MDNGFTNANITCDASSDIVLYAIWTAVPSTGNPPGNTTNNILAAKPNPQTGVK